MSFIQENLTDVRERIRRACEAAGRNPDEVTLIAVSKTKPVSAIREVMEAGVKDFGENKPQELRDKYEEIGPGLSWHMIGHLQRNKIKYIIDKVCMIHSVDTPALAEDISAQAVKRGLVIPVLIEVNMAGEESKFGVRPEEAEPVIPHITLVVSTAENRGPPPKSRFNRKSLITANTERCAGFAGSSPGTARKSITARPPGREAGPRRAAVP